MDTIIVASTNGVAKSVTEWIPPSRAAVIHAVDNFSAFSILQATANIKLLISDVAISDLPATTFLQCIHDIPEYEELPIIFVADGEPGQSVERLLKLKSTYFLQKPMNKEHFLACANKYLVG
jgi:DNA-binding NtrC family response regulator